MSLADWFARNFGTGPFDSLDDVREAISTAKFRPRLVAVNNAPSRDEFEAWRDDPVTKFVMAALLHNANECRDQWLAVSWEGGEANQRTLDGLRERSDALLGFTADYEAFCETLGLEPQEEEQAA